jgi:lipopolysaccharide transport system ATP-binding protein
MSAPVIRVDGLWKQYRLGVGRSHHKTFREMLTGLVTNPARRLKRGLRRQPAQVGEEAFWALQDVSFQVAQGETIGVIDRNGAGKSTLLKVLSSITAPTRGVIRLRGHVGALLEVGCGFHPELTGRENVFLNGAILGMPRKEIRRKFDEIVAFAEVERFLDTQVKHYSSGMYMRLAFAVAAHLEPETLIVDEVLAVGDAAFQNRCLGKMSHIAGEGRTVLFVSHNMSAVLRLCRRGILIEAGRIVLEGDIQTVVNRYLSGTTHQEGVKEWSARDRAPDAVLIPLAIRLKDAHSALCGTIPCTQPFSVEFEYELTAPRRGLRTAFYISTALGDYLFTTRDLDDPAAFARWQTRPAGRGRVVCHFPANLFGEGQFVVGVNVGIPGVERLFQDPNALTFRTDLAGGVGSQFPPADASGPLRPLLRWDIE